MKNKRSFRLIAWMLTMVMIFNILPVSAFAVDDAVSNTDQSPDLGTEYSYLIVGNLDTETPENKSGQAFTVKYVIKGEYTYSGNNLLLSQYTKKVTNDNPATISPDSITGCSVDGNSRQWDASEKVLYFYPVPDRKSVV